VAALDVQTGNILWQTFTTPDNGGRANDSWSGAAVWVRSAASASQRVD
jgi:hypothetical protein